jgi:hypothetical protein
MRSREDRYPQQQIPYDRKKAKTASQLEACLSAGKCALRIDAIESAGKGDARDVTAWNSRAIAFSEMV